MTPTAARPPRWSQAPVVEVVEVSRDDRTIRVLGTALGVALWTVACYALLTWAAGLL